MDDLTFAAHAVIASAYVAIALASIVVLMAH